MKRSIVRYGLLVVVSSLYPSLATAAETASSQSIFGAAGIKTGLCLHLGCGSATNPGLTAELAKGSGMLVHGLAMDDAALARARKAIVAAGVSGRAMVEKFTGKRLPHLRHLARLIVVEDMATIGSAGITEAEIQRVLAPGGKLCVKSGGRWTATTKSRPDEMDEWTHPHHGPDGNLVSSDKALTFPISLRWIDGTPFGRGGFASCAPCRAIVLAGGRCFAVSVDDPGKRRSKSQSAILTARDAFSGLPLWRLDCEGSYSKVNLDWRNTWPIVATERRVYTRRKDKLILVNAASGAVEATCETTHTPARLLLTEKNLLVACWEKTETSRAKDRYENDGIRAVWWPAGSGSLEAFDPHSGKPTWSLPLKVLTLVASGRTAYALTHEGNPPTKRELVAVDLATGKEKWRVPHTTFGEEPDTCLNFAGPDCVVVSKTKNKGKREVFVLSESDGKVVARIPGTTARSLVGGTLWCSNGRYDLKTGKKVPGSGVGSTYAGSNVVGGCIPPIVVGSRYVTNSRRSSFLELPKGPKGRAARRSYSGARGACIMGMVPSNGMFYTSQNNCACNGAQVGGFLAIGPCEPPPTAEVFAASRPVEKGPAFGCTGPAAEKADWPTYRQNPERSGGNPTNLPEQLKQAWKTQCVDAGKGPLAEAWNARIGAPQPLTAPIVVSGKVMVAGFNSGEVMALNAETGAIEWKTPLASRIDSPPTYHKGLLLVGCHDGWVYALRATDGALAYRIRIAPDERRMISHGMVESVWPATGAVLVHDGIAFATAGRSTKTDGGIALVAFKPETGETVWTRCLGGKLTHLIDIAAIRKGELAWNRLRLDPKTGKSLPPAQRYYGHYSMIDGSWSAGYGKRSGRGFQLGKVCGNMMAWNQKLVVLGSSAVERAKVEMPKPDPKARPRHPVRFKRNELTWSTNLKPHRQWARLNAMALSENTVLYAGSVYTHLDPGKYAGSFIWVKSPKDGSTRQKAIKLNAPAAYDGLAVAGGRVFVSLQDGSIVCYGK